MACPHVAGVAALAWSHYPNRTRDWVRIWLRSSADDLGDSGYDSYYGHGRVNARKTVEMSPPSHELIAYTWETPPYVELGTPATINATILNFGENETGLTVELLANGTVVNSGTIDILPGGNSATVNLAWSPTVEGSYNITFYVVPVVGEVSLENNALWKHMYVGFPVKAVVLHSLGNVNGDIITNWQTLTNEWYLFGDTMTYIDYTSLNKKDITYDDIRATEADVLIISCAYDPNLGWQFTDSEIEAIQRYVHEGHGLIATCATLYHGVPNNNKLAPLFGLNKTTVWRADQGTDLLHVLNTTHPVFDDVPNPLVFPEVATTLPNDGRWDSNELVGGTYLAIGHYQESAITVFRGLVYVSPLLEIIPPYYHHHLQLLYNAIRWSQYEKPEHELTVSLEAPTHLNPGESALLNATVSNIGLSNETDVSIYLLVNDTVVDTTTISLLVNDTSQTIEYMWSPSIEGRYNITAYAPPVPNESILADNVVAEMVRVRLGGGLVVFEEAHLPPYTIGSNPAAEVVGGYSEFANYIIANGYTVSTINPGTTITPDVLAPVDVLVIVAPSNSYYDSELNAIEDWVRNGGNLLLISDNGYYGYQARTIATRFGINMQGDMICDSDENVGYPYWPFYDGSNIIPHMATDGVSRVEMYAGDGIIWAPTGEMPLIRTDSDGTAYWYNSGRSAPGISVASAFEGGTTGSGRLVVVTDTNVWDSAYDADGDGTRDFYDSYNEIFALDCIDWLSIRYPHDLSVGLDAPNVAKLGDLTKLNATVVNRGLNNETDVELRLLINGSTVDSVVLPELSSLQHYTLGYAWTPEIEGAYNITAYVLPVSGEDYVADNVAAKDVSVRQLKNVLFDQTHQTDYIGNYYLWTTSLLQRGYLVDALTVSPVTSDLLDACDVFVIPQAMVSYTLDELLAIQNFVMNGGGLLVIGDDYPYIYTDLTGFAGITWAYGGTSGITTDITPHPVTAGVFSIYLDYPMTVLYVNGTAEALVRDPASNIMLSVSEQLPGKVLAFADEGSLWDYGIGREYNLLLADNMIDWLSVPIPCEHDLAVSLEVPSVLQGGESALLNATVRNRGLNNETGVELQLLVNGTTVDSIILPELPTNASYTLRYLLGSAIGGRRYNVTAYSLPVLGENNTLNNLVTRIITVPFYARTYLSPQWTGGGTPVNWHADDGSWQYTLPFDFPFYGVYYRTIYISSNGLVTFNGPDTSWGNSILWLASKRAITPAWDDWVTYDPYDIYIWQNVTHVGIRWSVRALGSEFVSDFEAILRMDGLIQFNYGYNNGYISATIGISDGNGEVIAEDATNLNYMNTITFTPPIPGHELVVSLEGPKHLRPGESTQLNATVTNFGSNNESNVELQLLVNDSQTASVMIPTLLVWQTYTLGYNWTPTNEGTYNITANAPPILSEESTENNAATKLVKVMETRGSVLFDQTHGTDNLIYYGLWIENLTERGYVVDSITFGPIVPDVFEGYDVFVIPQALVSYTLDELSAIQNFVMNGGGLLVIGDDYPYIYTDLTGFAGITWAYGGTWGTTTDITPHPVTQGVVAVYLAGPGSMMNVAFPAIDLIRDQVGNVMLAVSEIGSGRVLGMADEDSLMDWSIGSADNLRLANNMVDWLAPQVGGDRDVAVVNAVVSPSEVYPGWIVHANVTVANLGNVAETFTVSLYYNSSSAVTQFVYNLQPNATLDLSLSWDTTFVALGNYTISAVASTVATETNTVNNMFVGGTVEVRLIGDIKKDRVVDVFDCILASMAFGATPSDPQWNLFCDMKQDNVIDIFDMVLIAEHFGECQ